MSRNCAFRDGENGQDVVDARGGVVIAHWDVNPLMFSATELRLGETDHRGESPRSLPDHSLVWCWSGWRGGGPLDENDESPPMLGGASWEALDVFCRGVAPELRERGSRLLVRTHHRHVLSDVPSCLRFLREREAARESDVFGLMLDGASMLAPSMRRDARDHLRRIEEILAPLAAAMVDAETGAVVVRA